MPNDIYSGADNVGVYDVKTGKWRPATNAEQAKVVADRAAMHRQRLKSFVKDAALGTAGVVAGGYGLAALAGGGGIAAPAAAAHTAAVAPTGVTTGLGGWTTATGAPAFSFGTGAGTDLGAGAAASAAGNVIGAGAPIVTGNAGLGWIPPGANMAGFSVRDALDLGKTVSGLYSSNRASNAQQEGADAYAQAYKDAQAKAQKLLEDEFAEKKRVDQRDFLEKQRIEALNRSDYERTEAERKAAYAAVEARRAPFRQAAEGVLSKWMGGGITPSSQVAAQMPADWGLAPGSAPSATTGAYAWGVPAPIAQPSTMADLVSPTAAARPLTPALEAPAIGAGGTYAPPPPSGPDWLAAAQSPMSSLATPGFLATNQPEMTWDPQAQGWRRTPPPYAGYRQY